MFWFLLASFKAYAKSDSLYATDYAEKLDTLSDFLVNLSAFVCVAIVCLFIYFAIRFRRQKDSEIGQATSSDNLILEITWSVIPFIIFVVAFAWGWLLYDDLKSPPKSRMEVHVYGQMWTWNFVYKNGRKVSSEFYVPVNTPVKLIMTSKDVIHSFSIPAFRIKQDVVPGIYTSLWFEAKQEGTYQVFCTEFCGTGHSQMLAKVHVVSAQKWEEWLSHDPYKDMSLSQIGNKIFQNRCTICHRRTNERSIGPGLSGLFGSQRAMEGGAAIKADENYLRESILNPSINIVKGYVNQMTAFSGTLTEEELSGLIEYIKTLK